MKKELFELNFNLLFAFIGTMMCLILDAIVYNRLPNEAIEAKKALLFGQNLLIFCMFVLVFIYLLSNGLFYISEFIKNGRKNKKTKNKE